MAIGMKVKKLNLDIFGSKSLVTTEFYFTVLGTNLSDRLRLVLRRANVASELSSWP